MNRILLDEFLFGNGQSPMDGNYVSFFAKGEGGCVVIQTDDPDKLRRMAQLMIESAEYLEASQ